MVRILDRMQGGLRQVQAFTDRRDSQKKAACLYILTVLIGILAVVRACILLVGFNLVSSIFYMVVAALAVMGCHATRRRNRSLLVLYVGCMALVAGLALLGLILSLIPGVLTLTFHLDIIFVTILVVIEGLSVIVAYSLSKDLHPSKHAHHAGDAMEAGEQVISFDEQAPNEFQLPTSSQPQHAEAAMYHQPPPAMVTPLGGMMPVYDPSTGTYSGYAAQPMYASAYGMAAAPAGQPFAFNPYAPTGQPAAAFNFASFPSEQASASAAAPAPAAAAAAPAYGIGEDDDDEFDPFQEAK